jgi:hypothetical protein
MSAKHTPGPWKAGTARRSSNFGDMAAFVHGPGPAKIAKVWSGDPSDETNGNKAEANARLIAAAPDLLEALKDIVEQWDAAKDPHSKAVALNSPKLWAALGEARAAIAKAEDKS